MFFRKKKVKKEKLKLVEDIEFDELKSLINDYNILKESAEEAKKIALEVEKKEEEKLALLREQEEKEQEEIAGYARILNKHIEKKKMSIIPDDDFIKREKKVAAERYNKLLNDGKKLVDIHFKDNLQEFRDKLENLYVQGLISRQEIYAALNKVEPIEIKDSCFMPYGSMSINFAKYGDPSKTKTIKDVILRDIAEAVDKTLEEEKIKVHRVTEQDIRDLKYRKIRRLMTNGFYDKIIELDKAFEFIRTDCKTDKEAIEKMIKRMYE